MEEKVKQLLKRLEEVEELLGQPDIFLDQKRYRELAQEHARLSQLKDVWEYFVKVSEQLVENQALLLGEKDEGLIEVIKEEIADLEREIAISQARIETILVPPDPRDSRSIIMEIRAGTGGDEAALFVGDCVRMYKLYADKMGWKYETIASNPSEVGGYREYIMGVSGENVFRFLQYEGGTHRVQRIPETETQGRLHTSAITIAILLEPTEEEELEVDERELKIETFRSSGAGGQHVNVTDSAVRITHLPTNTVVSCQDERSQHRNKEKAMRLLRAKLAEAKRQKQQQEMAELRLLQVGTGDRSERIRTYNFPQNRVTDHRINLTLYKLDQVMEGDLIDISQALISFFYQKRLSL